MSPEVSKVSPEFVALLVRALSFIVPLALLPRTYFPPCIRFALVVVVIFFLFPFSQISGGGDEFIGSFVVGAGQPGEALANGDYSVSWSVILVEVAIGLLLSVSVGLGGYSAILFSRWIAVMVYPDYFLRSIDRQFAFTLVRFDRSALYSILVLFFVYLQFYFPLFTGVFSVIGNSLIMSPLNSGHPFSLAMGLEVCVNAGKLAFATCLFMIWPVFLAALLLDLVWIVANRYSELVVSSLSNAARAPVLLLVVSITLYSLSDNIVSLLEQSLNGQETRRVIKALSFQ
ncbi:hypothetical protein BVY03_00235 [bacterium K02(2017)]|nr:hypothetical protein BVY03_00235 [bacterium K02(2017)]